MLLQTAKLFIIDNNFLSFIRTPNHPFTDLEKAIDDEIDFEDERNFQ